MKQLLLLIGILFFSQNIIAQNYPMQSGTVTTCSGTFYDTGGAAGNYANNENFTGANAFTICPATAGAAIILDFTAFNLQPMAGPNGDFMYIYDGPDTNAPLIGTYNGSLPADSPGIVSPTPANTSGCLTIEFTSDGFTNRPGWAATITCFTPCQNINAVFVSSNPPRDPVTNEIEACQNDPITFNGDGVFSNTGAGAVYTWDFGDGTTDVGQTVNHSYVAEGYYQVGLSITDPLGCSSSNTISVFVKISTTPDFTGTGSNVRSICLGDTADITGVVNSQPFNVSCTVPQAGVTFLPDGSGNVFLSCIPVDCFTATTTFQTATDIESICINMEHSYLGDLSIYLISPNGTRVALKLYSDGGGSANLGIPFATAPVDGNSTNITPGTGYTYCFRPVATLPTLVGGIQNNGTFPSSSGGTYQDTFVPAGDYRPNENFGNFTGSLLNGNWCVEVEDHLGLDNGYIFSIDLTFNPTIVPPDFSFTPTILTEGWQPDPTIIATNGNVITVQPTTSGTICYDYVATDDFGCTYTETVCIDVVDPPIANMPPDQNRCDDGTMGSIFNLRQDEAVLLGAQDPTLYNISYHLTQADADAGIPAIANPTTYPIVGSSQTIFVRLENVGGTCFDTTSFQIRYALAAVGPLTPETFCDDDQDGSLSINLPNLKDIQALNGQNAADFIVTYHLTQNDADSGNAALPVPYIVTGPTQTIFVRVENIADPTCAATSSFLITIVALPIANTVTNIDICDNGTTGNIFDLTQISPIILGGQDPNFVVTYYTTLANSQIGLNPINPANAYPLVNGVQTIFVRIADATNMCFALTQFDITYTLTTIGNMTPESFCDDDQDGLLMVNLATLKDAQALNGQNPANYTVTYHLTQADATNGTAAITNPFNVQGPTQTFFVRVENNANPTCAATANFVITIVPLPIANMPPSIDICDDGTIGSIFDLTQNTPIILGGQDPTFVVTYYTSLLNSQNGTNAINPATAYQIVGASQTIFVRIADANNMCFALTQFQITYSSAEIGVLTDENFCDQQGTGMLSVNLPLLKDIEALNGQNPTLYTVTYHLTQADADNDTGALSNPYTVNAPGVQIFVRVESNNSNTCYATGSFNIIIENSPIINPNPLPLVVCDTDNDGFAFFDLTLANDDITFGDPNLTVTYHGTLLDAQNDVNELPNPYENDQPYNDVVFVRVVSPTTDCYSIVELMLEVRDRPIAVDPTPLRLCDDDLDGFQIFDLTEKEDEILANNNTGLFDFYYYEIEQDAIDAGQVALTAPDYTAAIPNSTSYQNNTNPQTIYVLIVGNSTYITPNNGGAGCYEIVELQLIVDPLPIVVQPQPYQLCDDEINGSTRTDQISTFDLTSRETEINGGNNNLIITWYETLADEAADLPIVNPSAYQNRAIPPAPLTPQTLIVRVTNGFGCKTLTTLTLIVNPNPTPANPTPLEICDDNNDGFGMFDLTLANIQILNNNGPEVGIAYYATQALAEEGNPANAIIGLYPNVIPFNDVVYALLTNNITGCFTIVPLSLIVNPIPDAPTSDFGDLTSCDLNGGGSATFNLTDNTAAVYGTQDVNDFTISYHTSFADADGDINAIGNTTAFTSTGQTIWVRLEINTTGCYRVSSFELIIGTFPIIQDPVSMVLCDDVESGSNDDGFSIFDLTLNNNFITNGDTALQVLYFETQADQTAGNFIDPATAYTNTTAGTMTLFVTVTNGTGCEATTTLTLIVNPVPSPVTPDPLIVCDVDNDGIALFNLTDRTAQITNGEPGVVVTYHEILSDAQAGIFPLSDPYQNVFAGTQTIYARATYGIAPNTTGCYEIVELQLIAIPTPILPVTLPDIVQCDDDGDGVSQFDLTQQESLIYGSQDPAGFVLTYHTTLADAQNDVNAIVNTTAFTNTTNPQDIFVRLESADGGCFKTGTFQIIVSLGAPIFQPTPLTMCDDVGEPFDGITEFDLTVKNDEITGGVTGQGVSYFELQADALANTNRIDPDTAYTNTQNLQTIFVRIEDGNTGCLSYTTLLLRVIPNPDPETPDPIILCDEVTPNDGFEVFDLTIREGQILDGETWTVTYHESYDAAFDNIDAIVDPTAYTNLSSPQIIYVRTTNATTGCFEIVELQLIVNPLPDDSAIISDYIICEINTDNLAEFDLTTKIPEILNGQDPTLFTVRFFESQADAVNNVNAIVNIDRHQNNGNPQIIYVGILNNDSGCYVGGVQMFNIEVREGAVANPVPEPYVICDNLGANDGIASFDLTDPLLAGQILGAQTDPPYVLTYYETLENAMAGVDPIIGDYVNIINPQVIYARVTNSNTDCFDITQVILKVELLPIVTLDDTYRLCVDENGNPIGQETGDDSPPVIDTGLDPALYTFVWELEGVVLPNETGPSITVLAGGDYTVTVTNILTGCEAMATTTVTVSSPPLTYSAEVSSDAFADNAIITVMAEGLGEYIYQLDFGPFQDSNVFENVAPGNHTITIKDRNGCGSVTIDVTTIDYPLFFTPNQDGYHDTWNVVGIGELDPSANIYIFDRFGKLLKQLSPLSRGWDGTYNGNAMPSSDYWFRIEYKERDEAKEIRGHFTLKR